MIAILADETQGNIGRKLYESCLKRQVEAEYIPVMNLDVKPCYNCNGCTDRTYRKCVVRDDGDLILPKLVRPEVLILVTPIVFGGYSFRLKRAFDKCAVIGDWHYKVRNHELVKSGLGNFKRIYAVGVKDKVSSKEKEAFEALLRENNIITDTQGKAYTVSNEIDDRTIDKMAEEISR